MKNSPLFCSKTYHAAAERLYTKNEIMPRLTNNESISRTINRNDAIARFMESRNVDGIVYNYYEFTVLIPNMSDCIAKRMNDNYRNGYGSIVYIHGRLGSDIKNPYIGDKYTYGLYVTNASVCDDGKHVNVVCRLASSMSFDANSFSKFRWKADVIDVPTFGKSNRTDISLTRIDV